MTRSARRRLCLEAVFALLLLPVSAQAQFVQQGLKLVGTGATGNALQGRSVAVSADGNTAIVGAPGDGGLLGASWVFTRSGGVWSQQGSKLVGTGATTPPGTFVQQGNSVAVSADGNTFIVGGLGDNLNIGAAWIFTRSGTVWSQQGAKLVGTGNVGNSQQGYSVSITELRSRINALRALHPPLAPYPYAETITSTTTTIKAQHILELRQALLEVYQQIPQTPPTYTTTPVTGGTVVVADVQSLRAAVIAIE